MEAKHQSPSVMCTLKKVVYITVNENSSTVKYMHTKSHAANNKKRKWFITLHLYNLYVELIALYSLIHYSVQELLGRHRED